MNAAVDRAIEQLKEARETLNRALDDPTLSATERALMDNIYYDVHNCSLRLAFAARRSTV